MTPHDVFIPSAELLETLPRAVPRYTSYPTADRFRPMAAAELMPWLARRGVNGAGYGSRPLAIYAHLPFCKKLCYFCACNKIVTRDLSMIEQYADTLREEIALVSGAMRGSRVISQVSFGGGTPTYYPAAELARLLDALRTHFEFAATCDIGIEVDPRTVDTAGIEALAAAGFNRISFGVQDFKLEVQNAIGRVQSEEDTRSIVSAAKAAGFASINVDLVYGLPYQTEESFKVTLDVVTSLDPDRIALFSYAHLPERFPAQRIVDRHPMPSGAQKLQLMVAAIAHFAAKNYEMIGMDHFAKPDDRLTYAHRTGTLHRNFQGYTTDADGDLFGLGLSAISQIGPTYSQNAKDLSTYQERVAAGVLPVERGTVLSHDDILRRAIIMALMCQRGFSKSTIGAEYLIDFDSYFADEIARLAVFADLGLVHAGRDWINVRPAGTLLTRMVASIFDTGLAKSTEHRASLA